MQKTNVQFRNFDRFYPSDKAPKYLNLANIRNMASQIKATVRKCFGISMPIANYSDFFRSQAAINQEKRRQMDSPHWYIIHPFSKFRYL